jgi:phosphatidylglycerophosphatase C
MPGCRRPEAGPPSLCMSTTPSPALPRVTIPDLIARLDAIAHTESCTLAFDGDGTLWSGDISDDVFLAACHSNWILETVRPPLLRILNEHGMSTNGSVGELGVRLFEAEKQGRLAELRLFEAMTFCYAGRSPAEVSEFADRVLMRMGIDSRLRTAFRPLLDWARAAGHACWLVTASPWLIARVAAERLGFDERNIIASRTVESETGCIGTAMAAPVPYREQKLLLLNARSTHPRLLAAFGDSPFDLELLRAAELGVAVCPKPTLERQLETLEHAVVLNL